MSNSAYGSPKRTTFRTLQGFKEWAFDHDMEVATERLSEYGNQYFVENRHGEILTVTFDPIDGHIKDAMLHREHVTHMLGSNTLATLLKLAKR